MKKLILMVIVAIFVLSVMSCDLFSTCTVIFNNFTNLSDTSVSISCFINGNYQGIAAPGNYLTVRDIPAGSVTVKGISGGWIWGPSTYEVNRNETLTYSMFFETKEIKTETDIRK